MIYRKGLHDIKVEDLVLNPENPRLPERLMHAPEKTVINYMLRHAALPDLMASIVENNFFEGEALVGVKLENAPGKVMIVEGNRRLAAVRVLHDPEIAEEKVRTVAELVQEGKKNDSIPMSLPVFVIDDPKVVENYLGFRHISGIRQWPVIAMARYVYNLYKNREWKLDIYSELARAIGSKSVYVRRLVVGYSLYKIMKEHNFYDLDYLDEETFDLSLMMDAATKYSALMEFLSVDVEKPDPVELLNMAHFRNMFDWLYKRDENFQTRVGETKNLVFLNKVFATPVAKQAFINDNYTLADAVALTSFADDNVRANLRNARVFMMEAQRRIHTIKASYKRDMYLVDEIRGSADLIRRQMLEKMLLS